MLVGALAENIKKEKTMFEVIFYGLGGQKLYVRKCDKGDILPTMATLMQLYESEQGVYEYQRNYAIQWRRIRE